MELFVFVIASLVIRVCMIVVYTIACYTVYVGKKCQ